MATDPSRMHFNQLTVDEKREAIHLMLSDGHTEHVIAHATGLSIEMVRRILSEPRKAA